MLIMYIILHGPHSPLDVGAIHEPIFIDRNIRASMSCLGSRSYDI